MVTGLLTKLDRPLIRARGRFDPNLLLDLPFVPSASILPFRGTATTFSRSSAASCLDGIGFLRQIGADVPCFDHDPADNFAPLGLRAEGQSTNEIRNNTMVGAVAATDTYPDNWTFTGHADFTVDLTEVGTEDGFSFIELEVDGTASGGTRFLTVHFEGTQQIAQVQNDVVTQSLFLKEIGGSRTGTVRLQLDEKKSDGGNNGTTGLQNATPTASIVRYVLTGTVLGAATAFLRPTFVFRAGDGQSFTNYRIRLYLPQCEEQAFATSVIETLGSAAVTRNADVPGGTVPITGEGAVVMNARAAAGADGLQVLLEIDESLLNYIDIMRLSDRTVRARIRGNSGSTISAVSVGTWSDERRRDGRVFLAGYSKQDPNFVRSGDPRRGRVGGQLFRNRRSSADRSSGERGTIRRNDQGYESV